MQLKFHQPTAAPQELYEPGCIVQHCPEESTHNVPLMEFMYLVFTCTPGESY